MRTLEEKYFQSILDKKQHIEDMLEYRKELQERAASVGSIDISKERVQTSHTTDRVASMAVKLAELDQEIEKEKIELWTVTDECVTKIRKLHDLNYIRVLHKLYIQSKSHKQVAAETNHGIGWVFKKHDEAIQLFGQVHYDFLSEWGVKSMDNSEQIEQLMNRLLEVEQIKQQVLEEETEIRSVLLEEMQKNQVERLENNSMKVNFIDKSFRRTVNGKKLKELYPNAFMECTNKSEIPPHIRVQVLI